MRDREICRTIDDKSMAIYGPEVDSQEELEKLDTEVELSTIEASCWISMALEKECEDRARKMTESSFNVRKLEERVDKIEVVETEVDEIELDEIEVSEIEFEGTEIYETEVRDTKVVDLQADETQAVDKEVDAAREADETEVAADDSTYDKLWLKKDFDEERMKKDEYTQPTLAKGGGGQLAGLMICFTSIISWLWRVIGNHKTTRSVKKLLGEDEDVTGQEFETVGAIVLKNLETWEDEECECEPHDHGMDDDNDDATRFDDLTESVKEVYETEVGDTKVVDIQVDETQVVDKERADETEDVADDTS